MGSSSRRSWSRRPPTRRRLPRRHRLPRANRRRRAAGAASDPGTIVRPLFGGELAFAGCATGASASLGGMVAVRMVLEDGEYTAVLGHLSEVEPSLLDVDPALQQYLVGPNEYLGRYGAVLAPGQAGPACPGGQIPQPSGTSSPRSSATRR